MRATSRRRERRRRWEVTYKSFLGLGLDVARQCKEGVLDVLVQLGARFHALHAVLDGQLLAALLGDLALVVHVALVADEHALDVRGRVLLDVSYPVSYTVK